MYYSGIVRREGEGETWRGVMGRRRNTETQGEEKVGLRFRDGFSEIQSSPPNPEPYYPSLHHSTTPPLHHSITPPPHHSIPPVPFCLLPSAFCLLPFSLPSALPTHPLAKKPQTYLRPSPTPYKQKSVSPDAHLRWTAIVDSTYS